MLLNLLYVGFCISWNDIGSNFCAASFLSVEVGMTSLLRIGIHTYTLFLRERDTQLDLFTLLKVNLLFFRERDTQLDLFTLLKVNFLNAYFLWSYL